VRQNEHQAEPIVAADSGIAPVVTSYIIGPERLHSPLYALAD